MSNRLIKLVACMIVLLSSSVWAAADPNRPNVLVIMGDDIGVTNLSAYSHGMMGYKTPNIDSIAHDGIMFTDYYAENSCTAGRAAFITGQHVIRTGLSKVGLPGADLGLRAEDPTLAELLKGKGYATGQFGKNHFGDKDEFLPTNHGFDEFYGNLYHLDSEEEPEHEDWPDDPVYNKLFRPRGVLKATADGKIEDTGALTKKRMETADDEFFGATVDFIKRNDKQNKPWFVWFNTTRMHFFTHVRPENRGKSGLNEYADGMLELDNYVGQLLKLLDDLKIANDTLVIFTTDNGSHKASWPDAGTNPFRNEKTTNWEGGFRVPFMARYPAKFPKGMVINDVTSHLDWVPTIMAMVGEPEVKEKLKSKNGYTAANKTFRVHLDGYNLLPSITGKAKEWPRKYFVYATDSGQISAIRYADRWKAIFLEQRAEGTRVWIDPFVRLRAPLIFDLRMDPFENAYNTIGGYEQWHHRVFLVSYAAMYVKQFAMTFKDFPPRQKPATWNVDKIIEQYMPK